ncbi:MAG: Ig-like domain-containing protein [Saprospiraceae bacterium]|nr:Ig-like domain-containing protein [Saprospiraceae bacterium]
MKKNQIIFFLFLAMLVAGQCFFWVGCAKIIPPTGGPVDTIPPQLDSARSTENYQTNFKKQTIVLTFEEYIELRDVFTQVIISPPTAKRPEVTRDKYKRVEIKFDADEVLRENATYTINFGDAIRDYTAGNAAPFSFVFSTGPYLDSLEVHGTIRDAQTNKPVPDVLLMLYDNLADTAVRKERPFYFARTDKSGHFLIQNVKSDTFRVLALEDLSSDYMFNQESERIGFPEDFLLLTDSSDADIDIRFFQERRAFRLLESRHTRYGLTKLIFTGPPDNVDLQIDQDFLNYYSETEGDTMRLWYHLDTALSWNILLPTDTLPDTITVPAGKRAEFLQNTKPVPVNKRFPTNHNPTEDFRVLYQQPLQSLDTSLIEVYEDTSRTRVYLDWQIDSIDKKKLVARYPWKEFVNYDFLLLPGAVTGFYGTPSDTLQATLRSARKKDFGSLNLKITALDSTLAYVIELFTSSETLEKIRVSGQTEWEKKYPSLKPGVYEVRIIEDLNANGRWDPGNYDAQRQPERIFLRPLENLRANWEVSADFPVEFDSKQVN